MKYENFICDLIKKIDEGKKFFKIIYNYEGHVHMVGWPRDTILFIQTKPYYLGDNHGNFRPEFAVLLNNKGRTAEEWVEGSGIGFTDAVDIVSPTIEDYFMISKCLKEKKLRYNKKLNRLEKL